MLDLQGRMRKSPDDRTGHEFDPRLNFSEFLEEARQYAREIRPEESYRNSVGLGGDKKGRKKSWTSSLISWLKGEKKSSNHDTISTINPPNISKPKKSYASGPIYGNARGVVHTMSSHRPLSGPLSTILFSRTRKGEAEVPYMSLDQNQNSHHANDAYGPLYLVT